MNKVFSSYQDSSQCFLSGVENISVTTGYEHFKYLLGSTLYNYGFLKKSIVSNFNSEQGTFRFFEFPASETGFLSKVGSPNISEDPNIHPLHFELYKSIGSILDSYSKSNKELLPYSDVFSIDKGIYGLGDLESDYIEKCKKNSIETIPKLKNLTTLAFESNGNLIQYDKDEQLYFYLADHVMNQSKFTQASDVPADTFYISEQFLYIKNWIEYYFSQYS